MKAGTRKLRNSVAIPLVFVAAMWAVFGYEEMYQVDLAEYGILPRDGIGLRGILFSPFIHGDWNHLINNTIPMLALGTGVWYFYPRVAGWVYLYAMLITGLWVWVGARESFHIGASGMIYAFAFFLFFSGVFNRNGNMMGLSLLVAFLYGGLVWGLLPIDYHISWESHLFGGIGGLILAFLYRKEGPQRQKIPLDEGIDQLEEAYGKEYWKNPPPASNRPPRMIRIRYFIQKKSTEEARPTGNDTTSANER